MKKKHIDNAKKYVAQEGTSWWDDFFIDQEKIIDNCVAGSWTLEMPFTWSMYNILVAHNHQFMHPMGI